MPPRKKATSEDAPAAAEPERRSTRIRDAPPKPAPEVPAPKPEKKTKKADPALEEYRPSGSKKAANKKRKKADVEKEDGDDAGEDQDAAEEESKPKKKTKTETKTMTAAKEKKTEEAKPTASARTERRKSGVVTVQPTIEEDAKAEEVVLVVGAMLPQIKVKNEKGEEIEVSTLATDTGVVIFTAPKADTPGCNKQACHFRDSFEDFNKLGYIVYALTADTPAALTKWQTKNTLGYSLLSDPKREFIKLLGAKSNNSTKRSHFVFEKGTGKLLDARIGVKPDDSHSAALEFVKSL